MKVVQLLSLAWYDMGVSDQIAGAGPRYADISVR